MRRLDSQTKRGMFLAALSIGERLQVRCVFTDDVPESEHTAQVVEVFDDRAQVQIDIEGVAGGKIEALYFDDGESLLTSREIDDLDKVCWYEVAEEQPEYDEPDETAQQPETFELPATALVGTVQESTAVALTTLPRSSAWLLEQANILDAEAGKYRDYSPPQQALKGAASQLRSAVGHVLAGGCEKVNGDKPEPF